MELAIGGGLAALYLAILGLILKQNKDFQKSADDKYVHQDVCKVIHSQISGDLKEIKSDGKTMQADIKKILRQNGH